MSAQSVATIGKDDKIPPRQRILTAAADLFYRHGIRGVGVDAIAEAAGTNKMTLYRHFPSKDELVAEYLRQSARATDAGWDELKALHPGDPLAQLRAWLRDMADHMGEHGDRGCPVANAAVELPDANHPARRVIEECKRSQRRRLAELCRSTGLSEPDLLADELNLMLEGARVTLQSVGREGLSVRMLRMSEALIAAHTPEQAARNA